MNNLNFNPNRKHKRKKWVVRKVNLSSVLSNDKTM